MLHKREAAFDPGMTQILEVSTFSPIAHFLLYMGADLHLL